MANPVIQFKRGLLTNLPGLLAGEPGFTTDSYDLYVGLTSETATNKIVGSGRFWTNSTSSTGSGVNLVEGTSNGTSFITLKSPDSLAGIVTYTMPGTDGSNGHVLVTDGNGSLSFTAPAASSFTLAADSGSNDTFSTGGTLTFSGGEGIDTTVSDDQITIAAEIASASNPGISSFSASYFTVSAGGDVSIGDAAADGSTKGIASFDSTDFSASSGNITLNAERIEDIVGAAITTGTQTLITVSYDDANAEYDFVVDNDLSNYDNTSSAFITASSSDTLTNKTFDANGSGNSLSNVEVADFAAGVVDTDISSVSASDDTLASAKAIKTYVDDQDANIASDTLTFTNKTFDANGTGNSISNLEVADFASGVIDTDLSSVSASDDTLASAKAIKAYVDAQVTAQDLDITTDSGTIAIDLDSETLTVSGTANEIETSATGNTITIGLPSAVIVTTSLTTPSVQATNLKANDGTAAITITDSTGAVATSGNLTVAGNLIVNGSTTQVNTTTTTVDDTLFDLGTVSGSAPSSDLNKDIGILFNYFTTSAKKAAVYWDDSVSRIAVGSDVSESSSVLTASAYAALEIGSLWVNDCAGQSQVISCTGSERFLENITIDGGTF